LQIAASVPDSAVVHAGRVVPTLIYVLFTRGRHPHPAPPRLDGAMGSAMGDKVQKRDVKKSDICLVRERVADKSARWPTVVRRRLRIALGGWGFHAVFERENDVQS
jgi:hypothetical protein